MVEEEGREREGEIKEAWFSSPQLQTATAVTFLRLLSLPSPVSRAFLFLSLLPLGGVSERLDSKSCGVT